MKKGFTLNELLLAMAIIGLILVLALPRVLQNVDQKSKVTALQSAYNVLSNAMTTLMTDERAKDMTRTSLYVDSSDDRAEAAEAFVTKYLNIKHDCEDINSCFAERYLNINGDSVGTVNTDGAYCAQLSTGASICVKASTDADYPIIIWIDTNGTERPNIAGRDFFRLFVYKDGFLSDGITYNGDSETLDPWFGLATYKPVDCIENRYGGGCLYRVMKSDWVMDY